MPVFLEEMVDIIKWLPTLKFQNCPKSTYIYVDWGTEHWELEKIIIWEQLCQIKSNIIDRVQICPFQEYLKHVMHQFIFYSVFGMNLQVDLPKYGNLFLHLSKVRKDIYSSSSSFLRVAWFVLEHKQKRHPLKCFSVCCISFRQS